MAVTGGENRDPEPAASTPKNSPNPEQTAEPSSPELSEEHANPEGATPEQAREIAEELPVVVVDLDRELAFRVGELSPFMSPETCLAASKGPGSM